MISVEENIISIIIPAYNAEKYIGKCLESVVRQSYANLEIIVVDDGSRDATGRIIDRYKEKDERLKAIHQDNMGQAKARNVGLECAKGKYIMFLDSDDWLDPNCCEIVLNEIEKEQADIVLFEYFKEYKNHAVQMETYKQEKLKTTKNGEKQFWLYDMRTIAVWGKLYRSKILRNKQFDERIQMAEDVEFNYRVYDGVEKATYINCPLLHYRIHEESTVHGFDSKVKEKFDVTLKKMQELEKSNNRDHVEAYYSFMAIAFLVVCQNWIVMNKSTSIFQKRREVLKLKKSSSYNNLFQNIKNVRIPFSRKFVLLMAKKDMVFAFLGIIFLKKWNERRI